LASAAPTNKELSLLKSRPSRLICILRTDPLSRRSWSDGSALEWTAQAAERAQRLYARPEAVTLCWQALGLIDRLPQTAERSRTHIDMTLGLVIQPGWARDESQLREGLRHIATAKRAAAEGGDLGVLVKLEARE
jgi:hypothetical protein